MKCDLKEDGVAFRLAEGSPEERKDLHPKEVRRDTQEILLKIDELLALAYENTYLETKIHCNNFYEGKHSLADFGEECGNLSSYVERSGDSIRSRFYLRIPTKYNPKWKPINPARKTGYSPSQLRKVAGRLEGELAVMTEEHYARLRMQLAKLREIRGILLAMKTFPK